MPPFLSSQFPCFLLLLIVGFALKRVRHAYTAPTPCQHPGDDLFAQTGSSQRRPSALSSLPPLAAQPYLPRVCPWSDCRLHGRIEHGQLDIIHNAKGAEAGAWRLF
ncbi:hypothetical protein M440DRAFT_1398237 [Trichoderma longibrachiatum ATCC 18648]|uniref:Secreted protein n=1 Tax=Trichoderma longibrachiatum ATCC 18648 TaxID=983965 RepID=A0A2T4CBL9_TRILO|nr:hypothetical protein M440DRAFT_1398237 [Trichoderma longibrachiatum ATCC 18648]